ncbi:MAG: hypothetical protein RIT81_36755 [Deltaproteobacteria bacterium]
MDHEAFVRLILEPIDVDESKEEPILLVEAVDDQETEASSEAKDAEDDPWVHLV